jgi:hypothetical protein
LKNYILLHKYKLCPLPTVENIWGRPEKNRICSFRAFFQVSAMMGPTEKGLLQGSGGGKNARKSRCYCLGKLRGNNFTPAWVRSRPDFTSKGRRKEASQLLKGQSENFKSFKLSVGIQKKLENKFCYNSFGV